MTFSARVSRVPSIRFASFAIAIPLYKIFDYTIDVADRVEAGTRYRLPFANGVKTGLLLSTSDASEHDSARIKAAGQRLDQEPVLSEHMLALARWMADYYLQPLGEVLFQCLPSYLRGANLEKPARLKIWRILDADADTIAAMQSRSPRQYEICRAIEQAGAGLNALQLKAINPNWYQAVRALEKKAVLEWVWAEMEAGPVVHAQWPVLSDEQDLVLSKIEARLDCFAVHLLDGITGSGKTEVFLRLMQSRLAAGFQVIYLVPEIGLTNQLIERVRQRFGEQFAISHSALTDLQRYQAWDRFQRGQVAIMLGTRSGLFSQCDRLGLIIIDEEHDHSYRQDDGIRYHARDVAIKRAQMLDIPILLGSATPSLESISNCEREHYFLYHLDHRPTRFAPPGIRLLDVRDSKLEYGCSARLFDKIEQHIQQRGQVLIYLNRRGFAPVVMCHQCGWQSLCQHCDARLTLHQAVQRLLCHHCGFSQALPRVCPDCGHGEIKHYGIGTEQLEQGLRERYPDIPVLRIDRDSISSPEALKSRLRQLQRGDPCILIGTQMIAKGHDYASITLSVILDSDQALFSASYRASERLVQTVFQVAGRSGRGDRQGEAILQTRFPQQPLMQSLASQSYREIAQSLLQERRSVVFPPYARVVMFRADAVDLKQALAKLEDIKSLLSTAGRFGEVSCIGPMPALMTRRIGRYRAQLCLLTGNHRALRSVLHQTMPQIQQLASSARVNWTIDVDAYDM